MYLYYMYIVSTTVSRNAKIFRHQKNADVHYNDINNINYNSQRSRDTYNMFFKKKVVLTISK